MTGGRIAIKEIFIDTKEGILKIKKFVEEFPVVAEKLELFAFTEKPEEITDLIADLDYAINNY